MSIKNKDLKKRIIDISYKHNLSHLGSCLTAVDIIDAIYLKRKEHEPFVLSSGHAGLALYVVLEKYYQINAEMLFEKHGVHPNRDFVDKIYTSSGSLGHGLGIAIGMAITDRKRKVYVLSSDGEMAEGSMYESLNIMKQFDLQNIYFHVNCNGYSAYRNVYTYNICNLTSDYQQLNIMIHATTNELPFLEGLDAHYYTMTETDYKLAMQLLK